MFRFSRRHDCSMEFKHSSKHWLWVNSRHPKTRVNSCNSNVRASTHWISLHWGYSICLQAIHTLLQLKQWGNSGTNKGEELSRLWTKLTFPQDSHWMCTPKLSGPSTMECTKLKFSNNWEMAMHNPYRTWSTHTRKECMITKNAYTITLATNSTHIWPNWHEISNFHRVFGKLTKNVRYGEEVWRRGEEVKRWDEEVCRRGEEVKRWAKEV